MSLLAEEEKKKIEEEEEIRARIRLKFERKSPGLAGVLSTICPGLGQIYNGQLWKASLCLGVVLISLVMFIAGIVFIARGMPSKEAPLVFEESEVLEMDEEGMVIDQIAEQREPKNKQGDGMDIPRTPVVLIVIGTIGIIGGRNYSIKDAINTAKKINSSY